MDIKALEAATLAMDPLSDSALYYRLAPHVSYDGWSNLPRLVTRRDTFRRLAVSGLTRTVFDLAGGKVNYALSFIPQQVRDEAARQERLGMLERCAFGAPSAQFCYHDNHYVEVAKWAVTGRCNYKCKHCFLSAPDARFGELPTDVCRRLIREMAEVGVQYVDLTGGEPLVRSDFMELVDEVIRSGITIRNIATNGALVNERLLDQLEERGVKPGFFMSYDGVGWHDWLRGIDGAEKMLMGKFELLAKRGFFVGSAFTMHKRNAPVLRQTINRLAEVGVQLAIINRMINFGEWQKYGQDFNITHREVFETYLDYLPHFFEDGMPITVTLNRMLKLFRGRYDYQITAIQGCAECGADAVCPAARQSVFITGDGRLAPCISISGMEGQEKNFADLSQSHLRDAIERSRYASTVGSTMNDYYAKNEECASCPYRKYCRGGCRAQALEFDESDYLGIDRHRCEFFFDHDTERILRRLAETVPQAHCTNMPEDYPLGAVFERARP